MVWDSLLTSKRNQINNVTQRKEWGRDPYSLGGIVRQTVPQENKTHAQLQGSGSRNSVTVLKVLSSE